MQSGNEPLRVVDLSTGLAGGYCSKLLADAGADVVKIEPPAGDPLRHASISERRPAGEDGALFRFLHTAKRLTSGDRRDPAVRRLIEASDLIVVGPERDELAVEAREDVVVVALSPWGGTGPWAGRPWSDFIIQAECGAVAGRGVPGGVPFQVGGRTVEWATGTYAALAALAAARRRRHTGRGERVDVSMLEVATVVCSQYADLHRQLHGHADGPAQSVETPSIEPTSDGYVGFTTNSRQQFDDFLVLIERPDLLGDDELALARGRLARFDEWVAAVQAWTTQHPTDEIVARAADFRIPVAALGNGATVVDHEQFVARGVFQRNPDGGFRQPRAPYVLDFRPADPPVSARRLGDATEVSWMPRPASAVGDDRLPLDGIRILDLTAWWAGPASAHVLATLGADVIKVESLARPDGMRMAGGTLAGQVKDWWEHSGFVLAANNNKRGVTLDFSTPQGHDLVERLVATCDAVMENFTPRVLDNIGLTWARVQELNPSAVLLRMPAFGLDGPWRDRPGFAQTMEQLTGLAWLTGHVEDQPRIQRGPCDPIAGMHAALAFFVALDRRDGDSKGVHVEATMAEAALNIAAEQLVEHEAYGELPGRLGNRSAIAAPQGIYPTADDAFLAVSVTDDATWAALTTVLGQPPLDVDLSTYAGRRTHHDEIDAWLAGITETKPVDALVDRLVAAGVPAGRMRDPRWAGTHPQLVARRFFEEIDHPSAGKRNVPMMPFRFASVDRWSRTPAPTIGQHNHEVLGGLLGLRDDELRRLEDDGIIGTRPVGIA